MPVCLSCGETVDDQSNVCPHCFGFVGPPASTESSDQPIAETTEIGSIDLDKSSAEAERTGEISLTKSPTAGEGHPHQRGDADEDDDELRLAPVDVQLPDAALSDRRPDEALGVSEVGELDERAAEEGRCPNCGEPRGAAADLCTACGYHYGLQRVLAADEEEELDGGLRRAVRRALNEDTDLVHVSILAHVTLGIILGVFAVQIPAARLLVAPLVIGYAIFRGVDAAQGGRYRQRLADMVWGGIYRAVRAAGRDPRRPAERLVCFTAENSSFGDADLLAVQDTLNDYDLIDLAGTRVTDAGASTLFAKPRIRYINLQRTQVTPQMVKRIQRNHVDAWIWS